MSNFTLKLAFSLGAALLIILRIIRPSVQIDAVTLGLIIVAGLPWFFSYIKTAEFPGGWKIELRELKEVVKEQERKIEDQQEIINQLVVYTMSQPIFRHLQEIFHRREKKEEYLYHDTPDFKRDLLYLRDNGYIESEHLGVYLNIDGLQHLQNLIGNVKPTPVGNFYVLLREQMERSS